jgi:hypothetical protein
VLFSAKDKLWKVADFGLTSEGTSIHNRSTEFSRGTPGYRSPELLVEDNSQYTNKVDIFAMGCILYELVLGVKPFTSDHAVLEHYRSGAQLKMNFDSTFTVESITAITSMIQTMLQKEPALRPAAISLFQTFTKFGETDSETEGPSIGFRSTSYVDSDKETIVNMSLPLMVPSPTATPPLAQQWNTSIGADGLTVIEVMVNRQNTRAVISYYKGYPSLFCATLLDITSGEIIWADEEVYEESDVIAHTHPTPMFSEDGLYLAAYFHRNVVVVHMLFLRPIVRIFEIPKDMEISAVAIGRHGRRIGVSTIMPLGQMNPEPTAILRRKKLVKPMAYTGQSHIDVVETTLISNISLAYGFNGTRLLLEGNVVASDLSVTATNLGFCWDTASCCMLAPQFTGIGAHRSSPLYAVQRDNMSSIFMHTVEFYNPHRASHLVIYSEDESGAKDVLSSQMLVGVPTPRGFLFFAKSRLGVLSKGHQWTYFTKEMAMISKDSSSRYLWRWDIETSKVECFAKIQWDNLPPLELVQTLAETEEGLTLILKNGRLVFLKGLNGDEVDDRVASALYTPSIFRLTYI